MISALVSALRTEFSTVPLLSFHSTVPKQITAPSIVVAPGDPYLEPREAGSAMVRENWDVLVAVSIGDVDAGLRYMRELSLKVRKAVNSAGAVWLGASSPVRLEDPTTQNTDVVVSINTVHFRYNAVDYLADA